MLWRSSRVGEAGTFDALIGYWRLRYLTHCDRSNEPWDSRRECATKISAETAQVTTWTANSLSLHLTRVITNGVDRSALEVTSSRLADRRHRCNQVSTQHSTPTAGIIEGSSLGLTTQAQKRLKGIDRCTTAVVVAFSKRLRHLLIPAVDKVMPMPGSTYHNSLVAYHDAFLAHRRQIPQLLATEIQPSFPQTEYRHA